MSKPGPDPDLAPEEQEVLDDEPKSVLLGLISQLRKGMDLHRVTLPTFVLEPRSMCERITDFMSHPELVVPVPKLEDPVERFIGVVRYYLSGWHIRPKGVKKPYNPVLGEHFRCKWKFADGTQSIYVCEQVSHHPPMSAYLYASPENNIVVSGMLKPKSKFLGNSAATLMQGETTLQLLNHPGEKYFITLPNVYARGILFGTMLLELGDEVTVRCPSTDLVCEIEFKTKGFFSGSYNTIAGKIKRGSSNEVLYTISGKWTEQIYIKTESTRSQETLFDVATSTIHPKIVAPEAEQEEFESRRLWSKVTSGLTTRNLDSATDEKTAIEDNQRRLTKERNENGAQWEARFFVKKGEEEFEFVGLENMPKDGKAAYDHIEKIIYSKPKSALHQHFWPMKKDAEGSSSSSSLD